MSFSSLPLCPEIQKAVAEMGYEQPTPIQMQAIPQVLAGHDLLASAQTGTGKTAGFTLPILQYLQDNPRKGGGRPVRALILSPTRELAAQIGENVREYSRHLRTRSLVVFGGVSINPQMMKLRGGVDILIATPGRLLDLEHQNAVDLSKVEILVLDEADRMLDMGFADDITEILSRTPEERQTLLFSATWPDEIAAVSRRFQRDPQTIEINSTDELPAVEQQFYEVSRRGKTELLQKLLSREQPASCVVFCNTKKDCQDVYEALESSGQSVLVLYGDMEQRERDQTLIRFANGSSRVLVATDVASRGLDIKALELVINYELAWDPEVHVHRIGRTARAGESGLAISLCAPEEAVRANALEEMLHMKLNWQPIPAGLRITPLDAAMATLCIDGGKKAKIRPGDILGAMTGDMGLNGEDIGKIVIHPMHAYVAVRQGIAQQARKLLQQGKIKGKPVRVRLLK